MMESVTNSITIATGIAAKTVTATTGYCYIIGW